MCVLVDQACFVPIRSPWPRLLLAISFTEIPVGPLFRVPRRAIKCGVLAEEAIGWLVGLDDSQRCPGP